MKLFSRFLVFLVIFLFLPKQVFANAPTFFKANILKIEKQIQENTQIEGVQGVDIDLVPTEGIEKGKKIHIDGVFMLASQVEQLQKIKVGIFSLTTGTDGSKMYTFVDISREFPLAVLFIIFGAVVLAVAKKKGYWSIFGMVLSYVVVVKFIIPQISSGNSAIFVSLLSSIMIIPASFIMSHGRGKKTIVAIMGTFMALSLTAILGQVFIEWTHLTGLASEEASFIQSFQGDPQKIKSLILAGIIIAGMGILDDVTISQAAIVERLAIANPSYSRSKLFFEGMEVGRDHIASLVNTLILVYAGSALPLFLVFSESKIPLSPVINHELVATEIVRTLVTSIGIVLAVPFTTYVACRTFVKK